jgi:hypothetical protein
MTAEQGTLYLLMALGALWALYLLVSAVRDVHRRRPWWRERRGGDYIDVPRRRLR